MNREQEKAMFANMPIHTMRLKSTDMPPNQTTGLPKSGFGIYQHKLTNHAKAIKNIHKDWKGLKSARDESKRKQEEIDKQAIKKLEDEANEKLAEANKIAYGEKHGQSTREEIIINNIGQGVLPKETVEKNKAEAKAKQEAEDAKKAEDEKNKIPISPGTSEKKEQKNDEPKSESKTETKEERTEEPTQEPESSDSGPEPSGDTDHIPLLYVTRI
ncbi:MAG: hypothetical protein KGI08_08465 [Thaumarchaeota archaeon]|nr:hypothetical protein [Nitrososphaerota archaeon]